MEYNKLNVNSKKSWFISRLMFLVIMSITFLGTMYFFTNKIPLGWIIKTKKYFYVAIWILIGLQALNTFLYPIIEYNQWKYFINDDKVDFEEGIFFKKRTIVPIIRIQHITVTQGPINKFFNLATVTISTAGGEHKIPNIELEKANEISEYLKEKIKIKVAKIFESKSAK